MTKKTRNRGGNPLNHNCNQNQVKNQLKKHHSCSRNQVARNRWRLAILNKKMKMIMNKRTNQIRLVFIWNLGNTKNSNIINLFRSQMNNVNRNRINNYIYCYSIENKEENFNKLAEVINKKEYYVYKVILYIIENCITVLQAVLLSKLICSNMIIYYKI